MSEGTQRQRLREICSQFSVDLLNFIDHFLIWLLPPVIFILLFIGNSLWGIPGAILTVVIPALIIMSFFLLFKDKWTKKSADSNSKNSNHQNHRPSGKINQQNTTGPKVSIRTTTGYPDRYSPRSSFSQDGGRALLSRDRDSSGILAGDAVGAFIRNENLEDEEGDDLGYGDSSSTIAEELGNRRNQQRKSLTPCEWSTLTSPGFSSRIVQKASVNSPLSEYNFKLTQSQNSPFLISPNGPLKFGDIPYGSKLRSYKGPGHSMSPGSRNHYREAREVGSVYLKIAPIAGPTSFSGMDSNSELELSSESVKVTQSVGLGGHPQSNLQSPKYSRLVSPPTNSTGTTLERTLRSHNPPPTSIASPSSGFSLAEALANRKGKRNRDSSIDFLSQRNSPGPPSLNNSTEDNPKDSKRVKFIMPPDPSGNARTMSSMLPLTSHGHHENTNMTSESILEQMNQTEKRFLPDDDTPPPLRHLPKKARSIDRPLPQGTSSSSGPPGSPMPSSTYRKRRASASLFSAVEEEARGKSARFCNCTECYDEAAGVPIATTTSPPPQNDRGKKVVKSVAIMCDRTSETPTLTEKPNPKFSSHFTFPANRGRYEEDKQSQIQRLEQMLSLSFKKAAVSSSSNGIGPGIGLSTTTTTSGSVYTTVSNPLVMPTFTSMKEPEGQQNQTLSNNTGGPGGDTADAKFTGIQFPTTTTGSPAPAVTVKPISSVEPNSTSVAGTATSVPSTGFNFGQNNEQATAAAVPSTTSSSSGVPAFQFGPPTATTTQPSTTTTQSPKDIPSILQGGINAPATTTSEVPAFKSGSSGLFTFGGTGTSTSTPSTTVSSSTPAPAPATTIPAFGSQTQPLNSSTSTPTPIFSSGIGSSAFGTGTTGFGGLSQPTSTATTSAFGIQPQPSTTTTTSTASTFSFGNANTNPTVTSTQPPPFQFGGSAPTTTQAATASSTTQSVAPTSTTTSSEVPAFKSGSSGLFTFGGGSGGASTTTPSTAASTTSASAFGSPAAFGSTTSAPTFSSGTGFGNSSAASTGFGGVSSTAATTGTFGTQNQSGSGPTTGTASTFSFGNTTASSTQPPTFQFGSSTATAAPTTSGISAQPDIPSIFREGISSPGTTAASSTTPAFKSGSSGLFSFGASGAAATSNTVSSTTSGFGSSSTFGSPATFGSPTQTTFSSGTGTFGNSSGSTGFGGLSQQNTTAGTTGFGALSQQSSTATTGAFGTQQQPAAVASTFSFGNTTNPTSSSTTQSPAFQFGQSAQPNPTSGGLNFGAPGATASPAPTSLFGSNTTPAFGSSATPTPAFGSNTTTTPLFGSNTTPSFGATTASGVFGQTPQQQQQPNLFGSAAPAPGATSGFGFNQPTSTPTPSTGSVFGFGQGQQQQQQPQQAAAPSAFAFGTPNNNSASTPFQFGQSPQPAQGNFNFGGGNTVPVPGASPGGQMFTMGATSTTPRRRDLGRSRRYR